MKIHSIIFAGLMLTSISVFSSEVDQFTFRGQEMKDSSGLLNQKANAAVQSALKIADSKGDGCNEKELYKALSAYFNNHVQGKLTKDVLTDDNIVKRSIKLQDSVYQDWVMWDGIGMGSKGLSKKAATMSGEMRVGDHYIGVDKLEHMWGQGNAYFTNNYLKGKSDIKTVKIGVGKEKIILGGNKIGNGVFSYGDLSANFNGMRFWNHILLKQDDVLGADRNLGPYVACTNDKWTQVEAIDFKNYIDESMDEGINCSKFPTDKTAEKFSNRLKLMGKTCPMDVQKRDDMIVKYRQMSKWIINEKGTGKVSYTHEFKNKK
ncbi:MAG: hypothetical protein H7336_09680 [Bacteriovorax sp.]|nr:hypothetical protein [Bacteriovorax sp.]